MFFNIDSDTGDSISGWLAPDNPSVTPKLAIRMPGRPELLHEADVLRPDVRDLGLHGSGQVGFSLTETLIPGLSQLPDIEIFEASSRTLIYRRFSPERHLERKIFLFDASAMPQRRLLENLGSRFALTYPNSERYSLETMIVLINNHFSKSLLFSGRVNFNRYASFLENGGYIRAALLRNPVDELAERLLFLRLIAKSEAGSWRDTYTIGLESLVTLSCELDFTDPKAILRAFRQIDDAQRQALSSPMVRMLGCSIDEPPTHNNVSLALDHLASLDIVGTRARFPAFRALLQQFLGADVLTGEEPVSYPSVTEFADTLSRIGIVMDLLEHDLALYGYVEQALEASTKGGNELLQRGVQSI